MRIADIMMMMKCFANLPNYMLNGICNAGVAIYGPIDERGIQLTRHDLDKCGGRYSCGPLRPLNDLTHMLMYHIPSSHK